MANQDKQANAAGVVTDWAARLNSAISAARSGGVEVVLSVYPPSGELETPKISAKLAPDYNRHDQEALSRRVRETSAEVNRVVRIAKRESLVVSLSVHAGLLKIPVDTSARA